MSFFACPFFWDRRFSRVRSCQTMAVQGCLLSRCLLPQHHHSDVSGPIFDLDRIEKMAQAANPEIRVAVRKVAVVEAHVPSSGSLDDPSFMYRGWQVPLRQPWNYNAAQNMFMIGQTPAMARQTRSSDECR